MDSENWPQVKEILEVAIEQPPERRTQFIRERCSGDVALQSKVESLIDSFDRVGDFMEDGAIGSVADTFASSKNGFEPGDSLGKYKVVRLLGEGGMGTVYLADDPGLHRQVAVKVLRDDLWWYKQGRQRLLREARAAAKLDHPNICSIYEVDDSDQRSFIVMQYVEGRTLGDIMANGGLSGNRCLNVALQIAAALDEAHSHHLIHRDIKPANIIINEKGHAKVLDFGLAKSIKPTDEKPDDLSSSGAVMGTVPYMSPEQLRGKTIDGRSDIFSFGALLFEMVSGHQAFGKDNNAETISAILNEPPNFSLLPRKFRPVVQKAMQKRAADRYQTISELSDDLRILVDDTAKDTDPEYSFTNWFGARSVISTAFRRYISGKVPRSGAGRSYYRWQDSDSDARTVPLTQPILSEPVTERQTVQSNARPYLLGGLAVLVLAAVPAFYFWSTRVQSDPHAFDDMHSVRLVEWKDAGSTVYLGYSSSHNGKMIAFSTKQDGPRESIYVKAIPDGDEVRITKDQWINYSPIWSPDDQRLAFISVRDGSHGIYTSPFLGGETALVKTLDGSVSLRHWSKDGTAIYYEFQGNLFKLDLATGDTKQMTEFKPGLSPERNFAFSPDDDRIAYCDVADGQTDIWIRPAAGGKPVPLTNDQEAEKNPSWGPDGKSIWYSVVRDGYTQIKVTYLDRRQPEQITRGEGEHQLIDASADGKRIFYTTWEDRSDVWGVSVETGEEFQVASGKEFEFWPDVSPDGKSILYQNNSAINPTLSRSDIMVASLNSGEPSKRFRGFDPRWLPDSRHISFLRWQGQDKGYALWIADTVTDHETLVEDRRVRLPDNATLPSNRLQTREFSWSPDGDKVAYPSKLSGFWNVFKKSVATGDAVALSQNTEESVRFDCPMFSPDGKRVVYVSIKMPAGERERAISSVWIEEGGITKEIYSSTDGLRLLGWEGNNRLILELVPGVAKDGRLISGPSDVQLVQLPIAGSLRLIKMVRNTYADSAALSAAGKMIAFTARLNDRDDIFTISTTGGIGKKITSNNDPRVFFGSLVWAPNGKTIYFDKQARVNTISMFENLR